MNKRFIAILLAGLVMLSVMPGVVSALPSGATDAVQSHNVTLSDYNVATDTDTDGYELGEGVDVIYINVTGTIDDTNTTILYIDYTKEDGSTVADAEVWIPGGTAVGTWITESTNITDLVDITDITDNDPFDDTGTFNIVATVTREGLHQGVGGTDSAKGGFITETNLDTTQRTAKWQGYYGNISGKITLADSQAHYMYNWTWTAAKGGEVIATTNTSIPYWSGVAVVSTTERDDGTNGINAKWGWESDQSDDADATFSDATYDLVVAGTTLTNTIATADDAILPTGQGWKTAVIKDSSSIDSKDDYLFVGIINNDGTAFDSTTKDFQMIVPVGDTPTSTETYYFYVEMT